MTTKMKRYGAFAGIASAIASFATWWYRRPDYIVRQMSKASSR